MEEETEESPHLKEIEAKILHIKMETELNKKGR
jgi:hypothetical protein